MTELTRQDMEDLAHGAQARQELERTEAAFAHLETVTIARLKQLNVQPVESQELLCTLRILDAVKDQLLREVGKGQAAQMRRDQN